MSCYVCGQNVKQDVENCPSCKADLINQTEKVIIESIASYEKSKLDNQGGAAVLTNQRFIFYSKKHFVDSEIKISIPVQEISGVEIKKYLIGKSLIITTKNGESYIVGPSKIKEWLKAFEEIIT